MQCSNPDKINTITHINIAKYLTIESFSFLKVLTAIYISIPQKIDSIKNSKIFKNSAKFEFIMLIIFVIPMMPKDIFIYLGGISPVRPKRFLAIATLARIPGLFLTVYMGNRISNGNFSMVVVLIAIILIIAAIGYFIYSRIEQKFEKDET